ncbi:MAG: hypothetical protein ACLPKB_00845 [Xanthobacteraceae bacterium]
MTHLLASNDFPEECPRPMSSFVAAAMIVATAVMQITGRFDPFGMPLTVSAALTLAVACLYLGL